MQFLEYFNVTVLAIAGTFVVTLLLSTKIKDFLNGVPTELRGALNSVQTKAQADLKAASADVVARIAPAVKPAVVAAPAPAAVAAHGAEAAPGQEKKAEEAPKA
jgi:hypothetical protein